MATLTFQCNENNDLYLPDGRNLALISGAPACAQNLTQKASMRLGENQYNTADGVDYFGTIFTPQPDYDAARASLSKNLLEVPDVNSIDTLTIMITGDVFSVRSRPAHDLRTRQHPGRNEPERDFHHRISYARTTSLPWRDHDHRAESSAAHGRVGCSRIAADGDGQHQRASTGCRDPQDGRGRSSRSAGSREGRRTTHH